MNSKDILFIKLMVIGFFVGAIGIIIYNYSLVEPYDDIKLNESLKGRILNVEKVRGNAIIELEDGKLLKVPYGINYNYQIDDINQLVRQGDVISKNQNSDTIYITRSNKRFMFVIGKIVEEE